MNSETKTWIKGAVVLLLVFTLGGITGAAIEGLYRSRASTEKSAASKRDGATTYFDDLKRELDLTPDQASAMKIVVDDMRKQYKAVCAEVRPRYDELREHTRGRMRELLSPAQQQRFDQIVTNEDCNCPYIKK